MTDHRRLQRGLFRMQIDEALAEAFFRGDPEATTALGLTTEDAVLLREGGLAGVSADRGGRRRTQVLGNASSEFKLTLALAAELDSEFLLGFRRAPEFHGAIDLDQPLPFAFGAYARRWCAIPIGS